MAYTKKSGTKKGKGGRKRSNTVALDNGEDKYRQWALAVDKYFSGFPNKDKDFCKVSREEEEYAAVKYRNNRPMYEKFLITHNIFLAINMASKYSNYYTDYDELISAAVGGLVDAAKKFDPSRGNRFSTCAVHWIFRNIMRPFYNSKYNKHIAANTTIYLDSSDYDEDRDVDNYNYRTFSSTMDPVFMASCNDLRSPHEEIEYKAKQYKASKLLKNVTETINTSALSDTDKAVYERMFIEQTPNNEIRDELGLSQGELMKSKHRIMALVSNKYKNFDSAISEI